MSRVVKRQGGKIPPLDPDHPQSLDHPSHKEKWLELARALGRAMAHHDFDLARDADEKDSRDLRPLLDRPAERQVD
jgi:hypothetical protein